MRTLASLFRTAPSTYEWPVIASTISSGFQVVKQQWFNECVVAVDLGLFAGHQLAVVELSSVYKHAKEKVVHADLGGAAAVAITGYQINCASSLIAENGYVSKTAAKGFLDVLCGRVSGVETNELLKYLKRYDFANNDASTQRFKFAVDIAHYITNEEPSMILSVHVASLAEKLFALTSVVIAKAFRDSAGAHKLYQQLETMDMQFRRNC